MAKWLILLNLLFSHGQATKAKTETAPQPAPKATAEPVKAEVVQNEDENDAKTSEDLGLLLQSFVMEIAEWCDSYFERAKEARVRLEEAKGMGCYNKGLRDADRAAVKDAFVHKCRAETAVAYMNVLAPVDPDKLLASTHATFQRVFDQKYGDLAREKCSNVETARN
jgi:hypothetical protein